MSHSESPLDNNGPPIQIEVESFELAINTTISSAQATTKTTPELASNINEAIDNTTNRNVIIDINSFDIPEEVLNTNCEFENIGNIINFEADVPNVDMSPEIRGFSNVFSPQSDSVNLFEERRKRMRSQQDREDREQEHLQLIQQQDNDDDFNPSSGCTICRCNFEQNDMVTSFSCNHHFHTKEAREWLSIKRVCPSCFKPAEEMRHYLYKLVEENQSNVVRQPVEGRIRLDGQRFGEMEQDVTPTQRSVEFRNCDHFIFGDHNLDKLVTFTARICSIRVQKTMIFLVLRIVGKWETIQCVAFKKNFIFTPSNTSNTSNTSNASTECQLTATLLSEWETLSSVRSETVIKIVGTLIKTPNPIKSSEITFKDREVSVSGFMIISSSEPLPIQISDLNHNSDIGQDVCLNNRFLGNLFVKEARASLPNRLQPNG